MNQEQYIAALKQALSGLPAADIARISTEYATRFTSLQAAGKSQAEINKELGHPRLVAARCKARFHAGNLGRNLTLGNIARTFVSLIGLFFLNIFLMVPVTVYLALLGAAYAVSFAFFISGSAVSAAGLSGKDTVGLEPVLRNVILRHVHDDDDVKEIADNSKVSIAHDGITVNSKNSKLQSVQVANVGDSRVAAVMVGIVLSILGIAMFLLSLIISKYTLIGLKRYVLFNWNILRGHA